MRYTFLGFLLFSIFSLSGQEQLGLRLENYAGVSSLPINPAWHLNNPLRWDVNIIGGSFFVENNYAFIAETNTFDLLKNGRSARFFNAPTLEVQLPLDSYVVDFFDDGKKRYAAVFADIMGPAATFHINEQHAVGVFTRARIALSGFGIPEKFSYYRHDQQPALVPFSVAPLEGGLLSWSEIGVNYALKASTSSGMIGFGINLRFLQGYEAAYFSNDLTVNYSRVTPIASAIDPVGLHFGFTNTNVLQENFQLKQSGIGFATDLGIVNIINDGSRDQYLLKLGLSLLDIGYIKFDKNAEAHRIAANDLRVVGGNEYNDFNNLQYLDDAVRIFSFQTLMDSLASFNTNDFTLLLPTALSLQADYAVTNDIYLNILWVQRIPMSGVAAERGNLLAITPRYEHRWFSASLPLVLYNYQDFRLGLAARLGFLVIGSDNLGSLIGRSNYSGTDIYIALKFNPLGSGWDGGRKNHNKSGRGGKVKCYTF